MRLSLPRSLLTLLATISLLGPACKQGEGERCQIDDDCSGSLVCSDSQHICVSSAATPDSAQPPDARPDGPPADAGPDGPPVDAIDATTIDGLLPDI